MLNIVVQKQILLVSRRGLLLVEAVCGSVVMAGFYVININKLLYMVRAIKKSEKQILDFLRNSEDWDRTYARGGGYEPDELPLRYLAILGANAASEN